MSSQTWALIFAGFAGLNFLGAFLFSFYHNKTKLTQWIWESDFRRILFGSIFIFGFSISGISFYPYAAGIKIWHWQLGIEEPPWVIAEKETDPKIWHNYSDVGKEVINLDKARIKMINALHMRQGEEALKLATKEYLEQLQKVENISKKLGD